MTQRRPLLLFFCHDCDGSMKIGNKQNERKKAQLKKKNTGRQVYPSTDTTGRGWWWGW